MRLWGPWAVVRDGGEVWRCYRRSTAERIMRGHNRTYGRAYGRPGPFTVERKGWEWNRPLPVS